MTARKIKDETQFIKNLSTEELRKLRESLTGEIRSLIDAELQRRRIAA